MTYKNSKNIAPTHTQTGHYVSNGGYTTTTTERVVEGHQFVHQPNLTVSRVDGQELTSGLRTSQGMTTGVRTSHGMTTGLRTSQGMT